MAIHLIYFSPTGSTKKIGQLLTKVWQEKVHQWDLSKAETNYQQTFAAVDICYFAVPAFGGRVPAVALERMKNLWGRQTPAVMIGVYGNRDYDDLFLELRDFLVAQNFLPQAAVAAIAQHTIVPAAGAGRPSARDLAELENFAISIQKHLPQVKTIVQIPGNFPYRQYQTAAYRPMTNENCTLCQTCGKKCPVGAIPLAASNTTIAEKCILCMRCLHLCPEKARYIDEAVLGSLKEHLATACSQPRVNQLFLAHR